MVITRSQKKAKEEERKMAMDLYLFYQEQMVEMEKDYATIFKMFKVLHDDPTTEEEAEEFYTTYVYPSFEKLKQCYQIGADFCQKWLAEEV